MGGISSRAMVIVSAAEVEAGVSKGDVVQRRDWRASLQRSEGLEDASSKRSDASCLAMRWRRRLLDVSECKCEVEGKVAVGCEGSDSDVRASEGKERRGRKARLPRLPPAGPSLPVPRLHMTNACTSSTASFTSSYFLRWLLQ